MASPRPPVQAPTNPHGGLSTMQGARVATCSREEKRRQMAKFTVGSSSLRGASASREDCLRHHHAAMDLLDYQMGNDIDYILEAAAALVAAGPSDLDPEASEVQAFLGSMEAALKIAEGSDHPRRQKVSALILRLTEMYGPTHAAAPSLRR